MDETHSPPDHGVPKAQAESSPTQHTGYRPNRAPGTPGRIPRVKLSFIVAMGLLQAFASVLVLGALIGGTKVVALFFESLLTGDYTFLLPTAIYGAVVLIFQFVLFLPVLAPRKREGAVSVWRSVVGGVAVACIVAALGYACVFVADNMLPALRSTAELIHLIVLSTAGLVGLRSGFWFHSLSATSQHNLTAMIIICAACAAALVSVAVLALFAACVRSPSAESYLNQGRSLVTVWHSTLFAALALFVVSWIVWGVLLHRYKSGKHPAEFVSKVAAKLFVGTVIEAAAIVPLDVYVRRKSDCYCNEGTFWALLTCWTVGLIMFGPMVFILPLGRRARRLWNGRCRACGYDLSATTHLPRCPECGAGWRTGPDSPNSPDQQPAAQSAKNASTS
jgi:hypothetical protein